MHQLFIHIYSSKWDDNIYINECYSLFRTTSEHTHNAFLFSGVKYVERLLLVKHIFCYSRSIIGKEEFEPSTSVEKKSKFIKYLESLSIIQNKNQPTCTHKYHCLIHTILVWKIVLFRNKKEKWIFV